MPCRVAYLAILNQSSSLYIHCGFLFFSLALALYAEASLSYVTTPKLDRSNYEAGILSLGIIYTFALKDI